MKKLLFTLATFALLAFAANATPTITSVFQTAAEDYPAIVFRFSENVYQDFSPSVRLYAVSASGKKVSWTGVYDRKSMGFGIDSLVKAGTNFTVTMTDAATSSVLKKFNLRKVDSRWEWDGNTGEYETVYDVKGGAVIESVCVGKALEQTCYDAKGNPIHIYSDEDNTLITVAVAPNGCFRWQLQTSTNLVDWTTCRKRMPGGARFFRVVRCNTNYPDDYWAAETQTIGEYDANARPIKVYFKVLGADYRAFSMRQRDTDSFLEYDDYSRITPYPFDSVYW